jgi:hypothetical protein
MSCELLTPSRGLSAMKLIGLIALICTTGANAQGIGSSSAVEISPCKTLAAVSTPINISTSANTKIVAGAAAMKTYICSISLFAAAIDSVGVIEGTGINCAAGRTGVIGGSTAATGINFTANQLWQAGDGGGVIAATATAGDDLCLATSAAVQLSGVIVTVQQ